MAQTNMTVQVQCIFPSKAQCTILSVPTNATFRDIRKQVENLFNGDGCVLVFNGIIADESMTLLGAEFQKHPHIIAMNAMVHAKSLELHLNKTQ